MDGTLCEEDNEELSADEESDMEDVEDKKKILSEKR